MFIWLIMIYRAVYIHTLYMGTVYVHLHTLYMGTTYYMHIPLRYMPLCAGLYCSCNRYILCYRTGTGHSVHRGFRQGYTSQEWSGQGGSIPVAFSLFRVQTSIYTVYWSSKRWHTCIYVFLRKFYRKATTLPRPYLRGISLSETSLYRMADSCMIALYIPITRAVQAST